MASSDGVAQEEFALTRDEMANMVLGIESKIPLPSGGTRAGNVAAGELHDHLQARLDATAPSAAPSISVQRALRQHDPIPFVPD